MIHALNIVAAVLIGTAEVALLAGLCVAAVMWIKEDWNG